MHLACVEGAGHRDGQIGVILGVDGRGQVDGGGGDAGVDVGDDRLFPRQPLDLPNAQPDQDSSPAKADNQQE